MSLQGNNKSAKRASGPLSHRERAGVREESMLHIEVTGQGEPLVMLHGWGMHGGIWGDVVAQLAQSFTVHNVDLPGHGFSGKRETENGKFSPLPLAGGGSGEIAPFSLDSVVSKLSAQFDGSLNLLGWSLGGLIAQRWAARAPQQIRRLILVTSTPCFTARADWAYGMPQETLALFAADLEKNHALTLRRFLALQLRGSEQERELLGLLRDKLFSRGEPQLAALRAGLDMLRDTDLRPLLPGIEQPTLVIAGECDRLTPPSASRYLARTLPNARVVEITGAAHVPFLSHSEIFVRQVKDFLKND